MLFFFGTGCPAECPTTARLDSFYFFSFFSLVRSIAMLHISFLLTNTNPLFQFLFLPYSLYSVHTLKIFDLGSLVGFGHQQSCFPATSSSFPGVDWSVYNTCSLQESNRRWVFSRNYSPGRVQGFFRRADRTSLSWPGPAAESFPPSGLQCLRHSRCLSPLVTSLRYWVSTYHAYPGASKPSCGEKPCGKKPSHARKATSVAHHFRKKKKGRNFSTISGEGVSALSNTINHSS